MKRRSARHPQRGVVLLLLLVLGLCALAALGLPWLGGLAAPAAPATSHNAAALRTARDALLAYAATYPDRAGLASRTAGPGMLPCPDTRLDRNDVAGQADPPCALSSGTETGLLPWRTLDLPDLRDGSGAPLWYALANGFRNNPAGVVNSDTLAGLRLDSCRSEGRAVAALLIAPGPALSGQQRNPQLASARYTPTHYLEAANASRGDACFSSTIGDAANDAVLAIDRLTLNGVIETRVLAELQRALRRYYADPEGNDVAGRDPRCVAAGLASDCDNAWPWLSPWNPPNVASYTGQAGLRSGQVPLRRVGGAFPAAFSARWQLPGGLLASGGATPPAESCVRDSGAACVLQPPGFRAPAQLVRPPSAIAGRCLWPGGPALRCEQTLEVADPGGSGCRLQRLEVLEMLGLPRAITAPDTVHPRRESVSLRAAVLPIGARLSLTMTDTLLDGAGQRSTLGSAQLTLEGGAAVTAFELAEVPLDLEVDDDGVLEPASRPSPGELPAWFTANGWQAFVRLAHAAVGCTAGVDCLQLVQGDPRLRSSAALAPAAVALLAGAALAGQQRSSGGPEAWFEGQNALLGLRFEARPQASDFNDRVLQLDAHE